MIRDLLVHVDGSQAGLRRVRFAIELAMRCGARLGGLHVTPPADLSPRFRSNAPEMAEERLSSKLTADAEAAAAIFHEAIAQCPLQTRWNEATGHISRGIDAYARYADLVILGQYEWQEPAERHPMSVADSVMRRCGRPVLVVPEDVEACALSRVAITWDGSREAVRTVHDALPLLSLAGSVEIVAASGRAKDPADALNLSEHLAAHGIAGIQYKHIRTNDERDALRQRIDESHYDLLVMGGYSRPAWIESLFGGVAHSLLLTSKIPILLSH